MTASFCAITNIGIPKPRKHWSATIGKGEGAIPSQQVAVKAIRPDYGLVQVCATSGRALLRCRVHGIQPELESPALAPLKIVRQSPVEIAANVITFADQVMEFLDGI